MALAGLNRTFVVVVDLTLGDYAETRNSPIAGLGSKGVAPQLICA